MVPFAARIKIEPPLAPSPLASETSPPTLFPLLFDAPAAIVIPPDSLALLEPVCNSKLPDLSSSAIPVDIFMWPVEATVDEPVLIVSEPVSVSETSEVEKSADKTLFRLTDPEPDAIATFPPLGPKPAWSCNEPPDTPPEPPARKTSPALPVTEFPDNKETEPLLDCKELAVTTEISPPIPSELYPPDKRKEPPKPVIEEPLSIRTEPPEDDPKTPLPP